jgi:hypothetical protein
LNRNEKSRTTGCVGKRCVDGGGHKYYRPGPVNKEEPGYYYLKAGEEIKEGAEWYLPSNGTWTLYGTPAKNETLYPSNVGRFRRKIIKPEPKFKVGQKVKILHVGRAGKIGVISSSVPQNGRSHWNNRVLVDGDYIAYGDHELELVEDAKPKRTAYKYRELAPTEIIQKGDQAYRPSTRGWVNVKSAVGYTVRAWPRACANPVPCKRFRRKV